MQLVVQHCPGSRPGASATASGIDGISLVMVLLTTVLMPLSVLASWRYITTRERGFYALMLTLLTGLVGVFIALDLFLFYVFFELHADPDVLHHRDLGRHQPAVRRHQVLHLHHGRLAPDAGGDRRRWCGRCRAATGVAVVLLRPPAAARERGRHRRALAVRRLRARLRDQGADLPVPHLAARRPRRGADRRQRAAGRRHAQDRDLRLPPLRRSRSSPQVALQPGGQRADGDARGHRHHLRRRWSRWCSPTSRSWWPTPR